MSKPLSPVAKAERAVRLNEVLVLRAASAWADAQCSSDFNEAMHLAAAVVALRAARKRLIETKRVHGRKKVGPPR